MANFPIEYSGGALSGGGGAPRASIGNASGEMALARATGNLGVALSEIQSRYDTMKNQTQFSEFKRLAEEDFFRTMTALEGNPDPDTYEKAYRDTLSQIEKRIPQNQQVAHAAKLWLNEKSPRWEAGVMGQKLYRAENNWKAEAHRLSVQAMETGNPEKIKEFEDFIGNGYTSGGIRREVNKTYLTDLLQKTRLGIQQGAIKEQDRDKLLDKLNAGELPSYDEIEDTSLDEMEKQKFWEATQERAKMQRVGKYEITDPGIELQFLQQIDLGQPVTIQDIYSKVGKGLSVDKGKELVNRLNQKQSKKEPEPFLLKQYLSDLQQLSKDFHFIGSPAKEDVDENERMENIRAFSAIHRELVEFGKTNPTDAQLTEKYQSLIAPAVEQGFWQKLNTVYDSKLMLFNPITAIGYGSRQLWKKAGFIKDPAPAGWAGLMDRPSVVQAETVLNELGLEDSRFITIDPDREPTDENEFMLTVATIEDEAAAKSYYDKHVKRFQ